MIYIYTFQSEFIIFLDTHENLNEFHVMYIRLRFKHISKNAQNSEIFKEKSFEVCIIIV